MAAGGKGQADLSTDKDVAESAVLSALAKNGSIADTMPFAAEAGLEHEAVMAVCRSLAGDGYVTTKDIKTQRLEVTEEGEEVLERGSPEARYFALFPAGTDVCMKADIDAAFDGDAKKAFGFTAMRKWVKYDGKSGELKRLVENPEDVVQAGVKLVKEGKVDDVEPRLLKELRSKGRKLLAEVRMLSFCVEKGPEFQEERKKAAADLTAEMMASGDWKSATFKDYNLDAEGVPTGGGHLHMLLKMRTAFRRVLLDMGFQEMPTSRFVESSFWNFDALFQPQSHPARDAHDTFFVKEPARAPTIPAEYMERVRTTHESGGGGSIGYRYEWSEEESRKNILRTHTTAVSSRMLYAIANLPGGFRPAKLFSIDRVFRNEALDATHLAEFHQVEGVVIDYGLSLGHLIGTITEFFKRIGITELRFKPAYNPYTEPSVEVFGREPTLGWMEVGNAGVFRPEMLEPMGIPVKEGVTAIAWGLSLERPTMIKHGISNIRELFGHKVALSDIRKAPLVRF